MAIERKDEVLGKAVDTDVEVIPRYDLVSPDGVIVAENVSLVLKNTIEQEGMPVNAAFANEILAASGTTQGSSGLWTLDQPGYVKRDGDIVLIKTHARYTNAQGSITLNINDQGPAPIIFMGGVTTSGYSGPGSYLLLCYNAAQNYYYILNSSDGTKMVRTSPPTERSDFSYGWATGDRIYTGTNIRMQNLIPTSWLDTTYFTAPSPNTLLSNKGNGAWQNAVLTQYVPSGETSPRVSNMLVGGKAFIASDRLKIGHKYYVGAYVQGYNTQVFTQYNVALRVALGYKSATGSGSFMDTTGANVNIAGGGQHIARLLTVPTFTPVGGEIEYYDIGFSMQTVSATGQTAGLGTPGTGLIVQGAYMIDVTESFGAQLIEPMSDQEIIDMMSGIITGNIGYQTAYTYDTGNPSVSKAYHCNNADIFGEAEWVEMPGQEIINGAERRVPNAYWMGRPLYEREFWVTAWPNATTANYAAPWDVQDFIVIGGYAGNLSAATVTYLYDLHGTEGTMSIRYRRDTQRIYLAATANRSSWSGPVVCRYTKRSDPVDESKVFQNPLIP